MSLTTRINPWAQRLLSSAQTQLEKSARAVCFVSNLIYIYTIYITTLSPLNPHNRGGRQHPHEHPPSPTTLSRSIPECTTPGCLFPFSSPSMAADYCPHLTHHTSFTCIPTFPHHIPQHSPLNHTTPITFPPPHFNPTSTESPQHITNPSPQHSLTIHTTSPPTSHHHPRTIPMSYTTNRRSYGPWPEHVTMSWARRGSLCAPVLKRNW